MENQDFKRYSRQIILEEIGFKGQQKLQQASVFIVGAGGLGCPLLLYLAATGIGKIGVIDDDVVDETNLQRQIIFNIQDLGKNKAEVAIEKLKLLNPDVTLKAYPQRLSKANINEIIGEYDLIIDGSDNFKTKYLVNDACLLLNKVLIFGSILRFEGQASVFNYNGGPDYRSFFPEQPSAEDAPNCADAGIISPLAGIIGSIMANEAIKIICNIGDTLSGKLLVFNSLHNDIQVYDFSEGTENSINNIDSDGIESNNFQNKEIEKRFQPVEISLEILKKWEADQEDFHLIDVREAYEYEQENIGGINIPLYELQEHIETLPFGKRLIFCCQTGFRSKIAIELIKEKQKDKIFIINILNPPN